MDCCRDYLAKDSIDSGVTAHQQCATLALGRDPIRRIQEYLSSLETAVEEDDVVSILPAVAEGCSTL